MNLDSSAEPLSPKLRKLDEALTNYRLDQLITVDPAVIDDVTFNWKIMVENFMEMYHNSRLHHGIHDWAPSSGASYTDYEPGDGAMFGFNPRLWNLNGGFNPLPMHESPLFPSELPGTFSWYFRDSKWVFLRWFTLTVDLLIGLSFSPILAFWWLRVGRTDRIPNVGDHLARYPCG